MKDAYSIQKWSLIRRWSTKHSSMQVDNWITCVRWQRCRHPIIACVYTLNWYLSIQTKTTSCHFCEVNVSALFQNEKILFLVQQKSQISLTNSLLANQLLKGRFQWKYLYFWNKKTPSGFKVLQFLVYFNPMHLHFPMDKVQHWLLIPNAADSPRGCNYQEMDQQE